MPYTKGGDRPTLSSMAPSTPHKYPACATAILAVLAVQPWHGQARGPLNNHSFKILGILRTTSQIPVIKEPELKITQRMLPHWEYEGSIYFVTFNTSQRLQLSPLAQQVVLDACFFFHTQRYDLFALVVMPDHVHMLMEPLPKTEDEYWSISSIMHSIKSYSAKQIPKVMPHIGTIWQPERYDHIVRDDRAFAAIGNYIRQNPVKANLANAPDCYPFFWQKDEGLRADF